MELQWDTQGQLLWQSDWNSIGMFYDLAGDSFIIHEKIKETNTKRMELSTGSCWRWKPDGSEIPFKFIGELKETSMAKWSEFRGNALWVGRLLLHNSYEKLKENNRKRMELSTGSCWSWRPDGSEIPCKLVRKLKDLFFAEWMNYIGMLLRLGKRLLS